MESPQRKIANKREQVVKSAACQCFLHVHHSWQFYGTNYTSFRKRTCFHLYAPLSMEFDSSLYIHFVDNEKAFDSLDRDTLWKLLRHYGIPEKIITLIRNTYDGMTCKVAHVGRLTESFQVKTGVRQGCLLSPFMFLVAIDWIMKTTTQKNRRNGIQWTLWSQLDDLDFTDDLTLLSHSHEQMQEKKQISQT